MKKGFTLIELMVVVVIIGIMVAFVVPMFNKGQKKQNRTQTRAVLPPHTTKTHDQVYQDQMKQNEVDYTATIFSESGTKIKTYDVDKYKEIGSGYQLTLKDGKTVNVPKSTIIEEK